LTTRIEEPTKKEDRSYLQKLWVPIVLAIGFVAGEVLSYETAIPQFPGGGGPFCFTCHFHPFPSNPLFGYHVLLTTVEVALLVALVVVYGRMYVETKANFALGLVVVLIALLAQALLSYPILQGLIGPLYPGSGYSSEAVDILAADIFTICAYTVFLYLSLD
jgi:hypothetical protein